MAARAMAVAKITIPKDFAGFIFASLLGAVVLAGLRAIFSAAKAIFDSGFIRFGFILTIATGAAQKTSEKSY
jgi:hypothetical protein